MAAVKEKNLQLAIGLNLLMPGLGYIYMERWVIGVLAILFCIGVYREAYEHGFIIKAWLIINIVMIIDILPQLKNNKTITADHNTMNPPETCKSVAENMATKKTSDYLWSEVIASWFLIGVVVLVHISITQHRWPTLEEVIGFSIGGVWGVAGIALVPLAVLYLAASDKSTFRVKRTFTISGWWIVAIMFLSFFPKR